MYYYLKSYETTEMLYMQILEREVDKIDSNIIRIVGHGSNLLWVLRCNMKNARILH